MLYDKKWDEPAKVITPLLEPWQQTLLEAVNVLKTRGWYRGGLEASRNGPVCLYGAVAVASCGYARGNCNAVASSYLRMAGFTAGWNDRVAGSVQTVIAALEKVALG